MNAPHIELDQTQIQDFLQRVQPLLSPADFALLNNLVEAILFLSTLARRKSDVIVRLLKLIFGATSETSKRVLKKPRSKTPVLGHLAKGTAEMAPKAIQGPSATLFLIPP